MTDRLTRCILTALILSLMFSISGCVTINVNIPGPDTTTKMADVVTFEDVAEANSREAVLSRHENFYVVNERDVDEEHEWLADLYGTYDSECFSYPGVAYYRNDYRGIDYWIDSEDMLFLDSNSYGIRTYSDGREDYTKDWYVMSDEEKKDYYLHPDDEDIAPVCVTEYVDEKYISTEDNGDGTLTVITETADADALGYTDEFPEEWENATLEFRYCVDKDSLELLKLETYICNENEKVKLQTSVTTYDVEVPERCTLLMDFADRVENTEMTNPRTVTYIYDPGTEDEKSYTITADDYYIIDAWVKDGYQIFDDPEGTIHHEFTGVLEDYTGYVLKQPETQEQ
ncbi:MAG: hypothetical protein K6G22_03795 [Lachnospiraceae bacterium]|nr:hypothetical protein [Lachnospiraceae bacterium]